MKTEAGTNNNNNTNSSNNNNSNSNNKMDFDMYPSISSGKQQDPVREVVMKYIDYFLPESEWVYDETERKIWNADDRTEIELNIALGLGLISDSL